MTIAVIGTGRMGSGFVRELVSRGADVVIGARDAAKAEALASELGAKVRVADVASAVQAADVVLVALPYGAIAGALQGLKGLAGKVVVDISNPITDDFQGLLLGTTTSAAEEIQAALPGARVVKAFNTIFSQLLPASAREGKSVQVFVAADDAAAKSQVQEVARTLGFEPVDAGPLRNSRFLEPVGGMNIHFGFFLGWGPSTAPAWVRA
ncbi:MAG: NADPH-dependent F420 reductase [Rhizobacter sp.]|nr:NADPH-dependent F420 reductase [Rhizobacter sp.]